MESTYFWILPGDIPNEASPHGCVSAIKVTIGYYLYAPLHWVKVGQVHIAVVLNLTTPLV